MFRRILLLDAVNSDELIPGNLDLSFNIYSTKLKCGDYKETINMILV